MQILCEINYLHETKTQVTIKETDSSFAKISYYIDNHLFEKQNQKMTLDRQWSVVKRQPAPSTTTTTAPQKIKGDVNGDKKVNSLDLQAMLRLVADGKSGDLATCDIDNNGKFDILDLKALLQKIL